MISIIMPTYNRAYIIERAIKSVLDQTYNNWELIIVDDASEDNTTQIIQKYLCSQIRYHLNVENIGANESRNIGAKIAKGDFLTFLDSDNYWPQNRLELQIKKMKVCTLDKAFLYGKTKIIDRNVIKIVPEEKLTTNELRKTELYTNVIDTNTIMIQRDLFWKIGGFEKNLPRLQDWEFVLRMLFDFQLEGIGSEECLSFNEIQDNSIGRNHSALIEAACFLYKKYMYRYLDSQTVIQQLLGFLYEKCEREEVAENTIVEICTKNLEYFFVLLRCLKKERYQYKISYDMENLLYEWHIKNLNSQEGTLFSKYFNERSEIKTIAIYGLGKLGTLFYNEIKELPVKIKYGIDVKKQEFETLLVKHPDDSFENVDWIVVTVMKDATKIKENLGKKYDGKIVILEELIYDSYIE